MKQETRSFYEIAVRSALERIVRSLDDALDLGALARGAALSPLHFHRIFRGMLGETPLELQRRLRLERAALRLAQSDASVTSIAFDAGYETHESFTRAFRGAYSLSPSEFRTRASQAREGCHAPPRPELAARSGIHFAPHQAELVLSVARGNFAQGESPMLIEIQNMPEMRVAAVRHIGPYSNISEAFARLGELAGRAGLIGEPPPTMLAIYHDDPEATPPAELRSDAAIVVPEGRALPPELTELRIPAGRYAVGTHIGPYALLGDAWARLMGEWLVRSEHRVGNALSYEIYRNTPMTAAPSELRTDLYLPIA